jgi:tRNA threonylcarbamoyl adenosine modification protein YjeE
MPDILFSLEHIEEKHYPTLAKLIKPCLQPSSCIALHGGLGAGKTSFARCFIQKYLANNDMEVPSPTFTLAQHYPSDHKKTPDIWHYDFYRLKNEDEIFEIGFDENIEKSVSIIEWPEKIASHLPKDTLFIQFNNGSDEGSRQLNFLPNRTWGKLLKLLREEKSLTKLLKNEVAHS